LLFIFRPLQIKTEKMQKLFDDLIGVMRSEQGVGISACQVGVGLRVFVCEDDQSGIPLSVWINPKLSKSGNQTEAAMEACLSIPHYGAVVTRPTAVTVEGLDRNGKPATVNATGWYARILLHELDHMDGKLFVDKMEPNTLLHESVFPEGSLD
jgi:peptide deformylase